MISQLRLTARRGSFIRFIYPAVVYCFVLLSALACSSAIAVDVTFNISYIAEANPHPPVPNPNGSVFSYADVWAENGYAYVGSDRGRLASPNENLPRGRGMAVFSISNSGIPTFLASGNPPPPTGFVDTTYIGNEMEDVEVYDGIGYFASDTNLSTGRTGVDIVDLAIPFDPLFLSRVDTSDCLAGNPSVCAHGKVHTVSIQRINANTPSEQRFMYTSDNANPEVKITNVTDPSNPQLITSLSLLGVAGVDSSVDSHEVVVRNNRLYVASKDPGNTSGEGYFHIYDVSNPASPVLLKGFLSGASTHTAMPSDDGNTLIVAEERTNGNVKIYDISMINQPNDPDTPILRATLNESNVCHNGNCIDAHSPHHVHVHGNLLFLPWYEAGLQVFNIANPANPVYVGAFDTSPGNADNFSGNWGVDLSLGLDKVLLSDRQRGIIVVNATGVVARGDYDQDTLINAADYTAWVKGFGSTRNGQHDAPYADGNFNGVVDAADYVIWRKLTSAGGGGGVSNDSTVPEPAAALLFAVGMGMIMSRRRSRGAYPT